MAANPEMKIKLTMNGSGQVVGEIRSVEKSFESLANKIAFSGGQAASSIKQVDEGVTKLNDSLSKIADVGSIFTGVTVLKEVVGSLVDTTRAAQAIEYSMLAGAGSAEKAAKEYAYIKSEADRLGISLRSAAESYGSFLVSAKAANVALTDSHKLFTAVNEASTVFHLSGTRLHSVFYALEQMMSMGVIRTQELKIQLGQALPGVYENFANLLKEQGKDLTTELRKGSLDMATYAKVLAEAINMSRGSMDNVKAASRSMNAEIGRMHTALFEIKKSFAGGLFETMATTSIRQITDVAETVNKLLNPLDADGKQKGTNWAGMAAGVTVLTVAFITMRKAAEYVGSVIRSNAIAFKQANFITRESIAAELQRTAVLEQNTRNLVAQRNATLANLELQRAQFAQDLAVNKAAIATEQIRQSRLRATNSIAASEAKLAILTAQRNVLQTQLNAAEAAYVVEARAAAAAEGELAAATAAHTASTVANAQAQTVLGRAMNGLKSVGTSLFSLMGGWTGILMMAGGALLYFATKETEAEKRTKEYTAALKELRDAQDEQLQGAVALGKQRRNDLKEQRIEAEQAYNSALNTRKFLAEKLKASSPAEYARNRMAASSGYDPVTDVDLLKFNKAENEVAKLKTKLDEVNKELKEFGDTVSLKNVQLDKWEALNNLLEKARSLTDSSGLTGQIESLRRKLKLKEGAPASAELELEAQESSLAMANAILDITQEASRQGKDVREQVEAIRKAQSQKIKDYKILIDLTKQMEALQSGRENAKERERLEKEITKWIRDREKATAGLLAKEKDLDPIEQERNKQLADASFLYDEMIAKIREYLKGSQREAQSVSDVTAAYNKNIAAINAYSDAKKKVRDEDAATKADEFITSTRNDLMPKRPGSFKDIYKPVNKEARIKEEAEIIAKATALANDNYKTTRDESWQEGGEKYNDLLRRTRLELDLVRNHTYSLSEITTAFFRDATKNSESFVSDALDDWINKLTTTQELFDNLGRSFSKMLMKMVSDLAASQLMQLLQQLGSYLGGFFGPGAGSNSEGIRTGGYTPGVGAYASGGLVTGPGTPTSDSVPILASRDEYVVQAAAVRRVGVGFLDALNRGAPTVNRTGRYASGGLVAGGVGSGNVQVNVINNTGQESTERRTKGPNGQELIEVVIGAVAADIRKGGTTGKAIEGTYGVSRAGIRRG